MTVDLVSEVERLLEQEPEPDDALRAVVELLAAEPTVVWAGIGFLEEGSLRVGPQAGTPDETRRTRIPVAFQGEPVGEVWVDGNADRAVLERVAERIAGHVLIGWDTGGEAWEP